MPLVVHAAAEVSTPPKLEVPVIVGLDDRTTDPAVPVDVVVPVPPFATASVPPRVIVPDDVIGLPVNDRPVVPPEAATDVTVPLPAGTQPLADRRYDS